MPVCVRAAPASEQASTAAPRAAPPSFVIGVISYQEELRFAQDFVQMLAVVVQAARLACDIIMEQHVQLKEWQEG